MKKILATISAVLLAVFYASAQEPMEEQDRLNIGVERPTGVAYDNAAQTLRNNLVQAFVLNGVAAVDSRFTTVTNVVELSKDVTSSAPVMYITELEMSIFVIDLYTGTIFGQTSFTIKGVGDSEGASYMDAIRNVKGPQSETAHSHNRNQGQDIRLFRCGKRSDIQPYRRAYRIRRL